MNSNRCSDDSAHRLGALAADVDALATQDVDGLSDAALAEQALQLRQQVDRLEGQWLQRLAAVDARGAAGADHGTQAPSTASWLRGRPHLGASTATSAVRTAQALFAGPSPQRPRPCAPASSRPPTPACWPTAPTTPRPHHGRGRAGAGGRGPPAGPTRLRRAIGHLHLVADPEGASSQAERRHGRRGLWLAPTWEGMVALHGLLDPEAGQTLLAAWRPGPPHNANDPRSSDQRRADALTELARRPLEGGQLPQTGGSDPS